MQQVFARVVAAIAVASLALVGGAARAETSEIKVAQQYGIG
jgi:hypothetical protein